MLCEISLPESMPVWKTALRRIIKTSWRDYLYPGRIFVVISISESNVKSEPFAEVRKRSIRRRVPQSWLLQSWVRNSRVQNRRFSQQISFNRPLLIGLRLLAEFLSLSLFLFFSIPIYLSLALARTLALFLSLMFNVCGMFSFQPLSPPKVYRLFTG